MSVLSNDWSKLVSDCWLQNEKTKVLKELIKLEEKQEYEKEKVKEIMRKHFEEISRIVDLVRREKDINFN